ncbi:MAG: Gfo/Idh/MocA family oxidoreductase [Verrucomicrobia bacterium]|nr:Gfo/Idh/MocA family oxidoreductase [Verrucomicrobiota bacterium]
MNRVGVALIGCGGISLQNHLPGLALCPQATVVALCDTDAGALERARRALDVAVITTRYEDILRRADVQAVILATPNVSHAPIALAAVAAGKHVFCEKPIAMNLAEAERMCAAARQAGVRHMTAFTYRFVPAMRYLAHLVRTGQLGEPCHFRACRLQDWGQRAIGWRQVARLAGTGELGDMLSHRIDYAHLLVGRVDRLAAATRRFHDQREGQPSDLEDWAALVADFTNGATGVWESSKVATGRGEGAHSQDYVEVNGTEGSAVFQLEHPHELQVARRGEPALRTVPVPAEFLKWPGSPRDPAQGDPLISFRYDQDFEFIQAIVEQRPCVPSWVEGAQAQAVMDAAVTAARERRWVTVPSL